LPEDVLQIGAGGRVHGRIMGSVGPDAKRRQMLILH
jgi:hypothetical protein